MNHKTVLETVDLVKSYSIGDQEILALNGININIMENDFTAIIGKSGSGKSTLMHLIGLLDTPTSGDILLKGVNTTKLNEKQLSYVRNDEIGFVFQSFNLLARATALENVILPLQYSAIPMNEWEDRAVELLKLVDLEDRMHNRSNELSGGQKQRVAIARALVNDPTIILADEPTGNLDSRTGDIILKTFFKLHQSGKTIIVVTHDDDLADKLPKRIRLKDGRVVEKE